MAAVGTDRVHATSTSEINTGGQTRRISTATEVVNGRAAKYSVEVVEGTTSRKWAVTFERGMARVHLEIRGRASDRAVRLENDVILLDRDVWHHYRFLLSRYRMDRQGHQAFRVLSPQAALRVMSADVEFDGVTNFGSGSNKRRANKFLIVLAGGFEVKAIADEKGVPLSIEIPSADQKVLLE
jgi:hypothetical protein